MIILRNKSFSGWEQREFKRAVSYDAVKREVTKRLKEGGYNPDKVFHSSGLTFDDTTPIKENILIGRNRRKIMDNIINREGKPGMDVVDITKSGIKSPFAAETPDEMYAAVQQQVKSRRNSAVNRAINDNNIRKKLGGDTLTTKQTKTLKGYQQLRGGKGKLGGINLAKKDLAKKGLGKWGKMGLGAAAAAATTAAAAYGGYKLLKNINSQK